jgi:O-antigen/teichoic acid export membrane protein
MRCFLVVAALSCALGLVLAIFGGPDDTPLFVLGCLCAGVTSAWTELKQRLQTADLQRRAYIVTAAVRGVASTLLVLGAALLHSGVPWLLFALAAANLLAASIVSEPRLTMRRTRFDREVGLRLLRFGFPLSISVGLSTVLMSIDKWMLQTLSGSEAVGYFTAATLITQVPILTLASSLGPSTLAVIVRTVEFGTPQEARSRLENGLVMLLAIVLPAAAGAVAIAPSAAQIVLGAAFWDPVIGLAPWLAATAVLSAVRAFYVDFAFQLAHKTKLLVWITAFAIAINVGLDIVLIPAYAERGAAMGSFVAYMASLIVAAVASRRAYPLPVPFRPMAQIVAATLLMVGCLLALPHWSPVVDLGTRLVVGLLSFSAMILATNVLCLRDRSAAMVSRFIAWRVERT